MLNYCYGILYSRVEKACILITRIETDNLKCPTCCSSKAEEADPIQQGFERLTQWQKNTTEILMV
ncbi:MAG: hypothetical protein PVH87_08565 [Desulfobacteraceae bacterium]